jgi:hypothetical protein
MITSMLFSSLWFTQRPEMIVGRSEAYERDKALNLTYLILDYYDKQRSYPEQIRDGWHNVVSMNYVNFCGESKVLVHDNRVVSYVVDDWEYRDLKEPAEIEDAVATVQLLKKNKSKKQEFDVYFIDYLIDTNSHATSPMGSGTISFWAGGDVNGGTITVYINEQCKGTLYPELGAGTTPDCGKDVGLTLEYKAGTHKFKAINNRNVWRGEITIYPGKCTLQVFSESNNTISGYK